MGTSISKRKREQCPLRAKGSHKIHREEIKRSREIKLPKRGGKKEEGKKKKNKATLTNPYAAIQGKRRKLKERSWWNGGGKILRHRGP